MRRLHERILQLERQLQKSQAASIKEQRAAAQRAAETQRDLQTRGDRILQLQAQLSDQESVIKELRDQLLLGLNIKDTTAAAGTSDAGHGSPAIRSHEPAAAAAAEPAEQVNKDRAEAAAVTAQLQQQVQQLQEELQASRDTATVEPLQQPQRACQQLDDSVGMNDNTADSNSAAAADLQAQQQQQLDELNVYVRQLETQAMQREALLGNLLGQVGTTRWLLLFKVVCMLVRYCLRSNCATV